MRRPLLVLLALSCGRRSAAPPPAQKRPAPRKPEPAAQVYPEFVPRKVSLVDGEKLVYTIRWAGFHAGEGTMTVTEVAGGRARIDFRVRSNRFVDAFYKVRDKGWSLMDTERGCALECHQKKREGRYRAEEDMKVDYEKMVGHFKYRRPKRPEKVRRWSLPSLVQDTFSCIYVIRAMPLELGKEMRMTVSQGGKNWVFSFTPQKIETLKLGKLGRFRAYRTKPLARFPGLFARKGNDMTAWVDVETGTVLRLLVDIPLGWITVSLARAEHWPPGGD